MPFLNYHHLMYFWTVAREGGVARAAEKLHLSSPTISAQIHELEDVLGDRLFERRGRSLVLTEVGQLVFKYADDIFTLGRELLDAVKLGPDTRPRKLTVGSPRPTIMPTAKSPTVSITEAMTPPCHCFEPGRRSNSGRIAERMVTSCLTGSAVTTVRPRNRLNGEASSIFWISFALSAATCGLLMESPRPCRNGGRRRSLCRRRRRRRAGRSCRRRVSASPR